MKSLVLPEDSPFASHGWRLLLLLALGISALLPAVRGRGGERPETAHTQAEWPLELDGHSLQPLALSAVEQRFASRFPGRIGRFRSDAGAVTLRVTDRPTRMLHPAADCYRGLGYRIHDVRLERDARARLWRCFVARRDGRAFRVCERIESIDGQSFTDTSAWYWAAAMGKSRGPWLAVTRARAINL